MRHRSALQLPPSFIEERILMCPSNESTRPPMGSWLGGNVVDDRALPAAPAHAPCHLFDLEGRGGPKLLVQPRFPVLKNLQRREAIAREGTCFHLRPNCFLAEIVKNEHAICQLLYLSGVPCPPALVDEDDEGILNHR